MNLHHAVEITLTRPATHDELAHAARTLPLAANHDATRLMTVVHAKTPGRALHRVRGRLREALPVDVITTHYPDSSGHVLLNITLSPSADAAVCQAADRAGQTRRIFVRLALRKALAQHVEEEASLLDSAVQRLLATTTASQLLAAVGRALTPTPGAPSC
ncbi:hypothetical protein CG723_40870 [Streptomyces sp. CB01635]|uniref:hypothetical protein n=1 Tax=unclassified Streptomyces TaxID=2593676 RepID=UPI000C273DBA|nr:hypothetical protein [Streptomyces sp. CB01635]PJN06104.1 hypothetical protein CG723_40870 [Streptomyces sp. CB01635]